MARKKYCEIYRKLVQGEGDMIGHIAYSLYKAEKVQYIDEYKQRNGVESVPDNEINKFTAGRDNQKSIEHYRGMAETILQEFMGGSFDDMSEQVISSVTDRLTQHLDTKIAPELPKRESWGRKFWNGCLQSMGGAVALSILIWLFANIVGEFSLGNMKVIYQGTDAKNRQEKHTTTLPSDTTNNVKVAPFKK